MNTRALLNAAHAAEREGDKTKAAELYNQILRDFPGSKEASSAKADLTELGPLPIPDAATQVDSAVGSERVVPASLARNEPSPNHERKRVIHTRYENKVTRISLMGGLIGALATNPRKALEDELRNANQGGWNAIHIEPHRTTNVFALILQLVVLVLTLGLFTWGGGYLVLLQREA